MIRGLMPLGVARSVKSSNCFAINCDSWLDAVKRCSLKLGIHHLKKLVSDSWHDAVRRCSLRNPELLKSVLYCDSWHDAVRRCSKRSPTGLRWSAIAT